MAWLDVEYELPEDGEVVDVKIGRYHVMDMRYDSVRDAWIPCGPKIAGDNKYPYKVEKWRRKEGVKDVIGD